MELNRDWELAGTSPGEYADASELGALSWRPANVPGTAAGALGAEGRDFDAEDWWFRTCFAAPPDATTGPVMLELEGIATIAEVYLNGARILESASMWKHHRIDVGELLAEENELVVACRALRPLLRARRRPAARWRSRVVDDGNLRWYRTMIFGRSPGFAPGPAAVGPWRPVRLLAGGAARLERLSLRTSVRGTEGELDAQVQLRGGPGTVRVRMGDTGATELTERGAGSYDGTLAIKDVRRWWPHTHGDPHLYDVEVEIDGTPTTRRRVGFRTLEWAPDLDRDGLDLRLNETPLFARGAVWTPPDLVRMTPSDAELRQILELVRDAGMNMLRIPGTGAYESASFHDLCDELGILVWQDLMFANLDYPISDPEFRRTALAEAEQVLEDLAGRPSFAVLCGNSEVEQQAAMLGLDPKLGRDDLWDAALAQLVAQARASVAHLPSTPCGGELPFHSDQGVAHYFGVSGYFRAPEDARRADVRFAAECLAFANVPNEVEVPVHHPRWKASVVRDAGSGWDIGAGWDFDDVRDHYLKLLFGVDPVGLRRFDHARYLELSRAASGEVMAEVMGEWRRTASPCRGALVLWLKDMFAGGGLGVLDQAGRPKVAYHHLRRALAPVAVWTTDEGVNGVRVHIANDRPDPLLVTLRVTLYQGLETIVAEASDTLSLAGHHTATRSVEGILGHFVDPAWAYRFGPPGQDVIAVSLEDAGGVALSQAFCFPGGRPCTLEPASRLGLEAWRSSDAVGEATLSLRTRRLAYGVRVHAPGFLPADDGFSLEPGRERRIALRPTGEASRGGRLSALNLAEPLPIQEVRE